MADVLHFRRVADGPRAIGSAFRRQRRYEVADPTGKARIVTLGQLDSLLGGRNVPADFWACVNAADLAYAEGKFDAVFDWPSGRRSSLT